MNSHLKVVSKGKNIFLPSLSWLIVAPSLLLTFLVLFFVPHSEGYVDRKPILKLFIAKCVDQCFPKETSHLRYVLFITVFPIFFVVLLELASRIRTSVSQKALQKNLKITELLAISLQLGLVYFVYQIWVGQIGSYYPSGPLLGSVIATSFAAILIWAKPSFRFPQMSKAPQSIWSYSAFILTVLAALPGVFTLDALGRAAGDVPGNLGHTAGEYLGVLAGKTPLVNFYSQYQHLLSFLMLPYFKLFGMSIFSFTFGMCVISILALFSLYWTLRKLTQSSGLSLFLYLPILGVASYPWVEPGPAQIFYSFNSYAMWPARFALPCFQLAALSWALLSPKPKRLFLAFFLGALCLINNLDFGLPACVGTLAALLLASEESSLPSLRSAFNTLKWFLLSTASSFLAVSFLIWVRSGHFPDFFTIIEFPRLFALYGFNMLPTPGWGVHLLVGGTYMACLSLACSRRLTLDHRTAETRLMTGMLVNAGIFGCGTLMYYMGRSYIKVLISVFVPWTFALALLICATWSSYLSAKRKTLFIIPGILLLFHQCLFSFEYFRHPPNVLEQIARLQNHSLRDLPHPVDYGLRAKTIREFVKNHIGAEKTATLFYDWGDLTAMELGIRNVLPFPNPHAILLKAQLEVLRKAMLAENIAHFFALSWFRGKDVDQMLKDLGFKQVDSLPIGHGIDTSIEYWSR